MADEVSIWDRLEDALLVKILAKASAEGSFSHCLVSKHWLSLSHDAQSCLKPRATLGADELRRVLALCPNLTSIISPRNEDYRPYLPVIAEMCPKLTHLEVLNSSPPLPDCISSLVSLQHLTLRQLTLSDSEDCNLLPIFHFTNLSRLSLHVGRVANLPEELGDLVGLRELEISTWAGLLESLPDSFTNLHGLQKLVLDIPNLRTLPPGFHRMTKLTRLVARDCPQLVGILSDMEEAPLIEELALWFMADLPCGLSCLKSTLTVLTLYHLTGSIPSDLGQLSKLQELRLSGCDDVRTFPAGCSRLTSLKSLTINECKALQRLPEALYGLAALRSLDLMTCHALVEIPAGFSRLTALESVKILACTALEELPEDLGGAPSLKSVDLLGLPALRRLPESTLDRVRGDRAFLLCVLCCGDVVQP